MPIINIKMAKGRTVEQKQELVEVITKETSRILKVKSDVITIVIDEYSRDNWASDGQLHSIKFGDGYGMQGTESK